jgi:hypothetical protein
MRVLRTLYNQLFYPLFILLGIFGAIGAIVFSIPLSLYMKLTRKPSQHELFEESFHRAISLIEMHKVRFGDYPENLSVSGVIQYLVSDDLKVTQAVQYQKVESGYELNIGAEDSIQIRLPRGFWQGLGLLKTNVEGFSGPQQAERDRIR